MEIWFYPTIVLAGFCCGFINTLAGSGSLITLPLLIFLGLPADVANGTNRIAILFQGLVAVRGFHKQGVLETGMGKWLMIPTILGGFIGARIAVNLDERAMQLAIAAVMFAMLFVMLLRPKRWLEGGDSDRARGPRLLEWVIFFAIGVYGGFIQAGVGIFLLAGLVLASGYDLVRANALKNLLVLALTPLALAVFLYHGQVNWTVGLVLALGTMAGAWAGTGAAARGGAGLVRWLMVVVVGLSAFKLAWDALTGP